MTKGTRYVEIPAERLVSELEGIGLKVRERGGDFAWRVQGREQVFDLTVPGAAAQVRIFTTLDGAATARGCGEDAIRVCVGGLEKERDDFGETGKLRFRPTEKGIKILRTAPHGVADRVATFLERLRGAVREAYVRAREVRPCPDCGRAMARREGKFGPFLGCTSYPECKKIVNLPRAAAS